MKPGFKIIAAAVSRETGIDMGDMMSSSKLMPLVWARHLLWHVARELRPDYSSTWLGHMTGRRDHSTVLHGVRNMERRLADNSSLRECRARIIDRIMSSEVVVPPPPMAEPVPPPKPASPPASERKESGGDRFDAPVMARAFGSLSREQLIEQNERFAAAMREAMRRG